MKSSLLVLILFFGLCDAFYNVTCVVDPSNSNCTKFVLPESVIEENIDIICAMGSMGNMSGCAIRKICTNSKLSSGMYCKSFSIYKDLCDDMKMKPCEDLFSMCATGTVVEQCATKALPLPSSMEIVKLIKGICSDMDMAGCEQCNGAGMVPCNVLEIYSHLCLAMPDMHQCADWSGVCSLVPSWPICSSSGGQSIPQMRMYFHTGLVDYVLFKGWVPRTSLQYAATWFAVFLMAFLFEFFRFLKSKWENKWNSEPVSEKEESCHEELTPLNSDKQTTGARPFRPHVDIPRALVYFVEVGWSLLLMLVSMTFNVGLFLAICAGASVGMLAFGRFTAGAAKSTHH